MEGPYPNEVTAQLELAEDHRAHSSVIPAKGKEPGYLYTNHAESVAESCSQRRGGEGC